MITFVSAVQDLFNSPCSSHARSLRVSANHGVPSTRPGFSWWRWSWGGLSDVTALREWRTGSQHGGICPLLLAGWQIGFMPSKGTLCKSWSLAVHIPSIFSGHVAGSHFALFSLLSFSTASMSCQPLVVKWEKLYLLVEAHLYLFFLPPPKRACTVGLRWFSTLCLVCPHLPINCRTERGHVGLCMSAFQKKSLYFCKTCICTSWNFTTTTTTFLLSVQGVSSTIRVAEKYWWEDAVLVQCCQIVHLIKIRWVVSC